MSALLAAAVVAAAVAASSQDVSDAPLSLAQALAAARTGSPALLAARLRLDVERADVDVAREWPNPEVRYERTQETPHDAIGWTQLLELPGKRSRRIAVARAAAKAGEAELAQTEAGIAAEVRQAFFALAAAQRQAEVAAEIQQLAERARDAARARFAAGDVSRLDVLEAELAHAQAENEAAAEGGVKRSAAARLNTLIGRTPYAATVVADEIEEVLPVDTAAALEQVPQANTALAVSQLRIVEGTARLAAARAERWPDPSLEATLTHGAEPEFTWGWRTAVSITIPLFTHHAAGVRKEEAALAALRAEQEALRLRIQGAVVAAATQAAAQRERYRRFREEILPRSREVEQMAQESYRSGQSDLPALLQALQAARELRSQGLQAAAEYSAALAELEQAISVGPR